MKPELSWSDQVPEREDKPKSNSIKDLCFSPDGSKLVVAVENRVLVYDGTDGELLHSLRGHKDEVYSVDYAKDGKHFASGGADHTVIIWTSKAEGVLKYTHNESIIRLAFSPGTTKLASCTQLDFGLWSREHKSVVKHKVHAKILSADWSSDGLHLALGFIDGHVGIRDVDGVEKVTITRGAPIWCLAWWPAAEEGEVLTVGCWDQTLSFYLLSGEELRQEGGVKRGEEHTKDRKLGFNPCSISYLNGGSYIAVGGSSRKATLYTKEGVRLSTVCETHAWVWAVSGRSGHDELAVGCDDGTIQVHKLRFRHVTAIYEDRYAYRDNMSDVIVQHIVSEQKVRIKCRDYVDRIAIFRDRMAVRLPGKVHVYELTHQEDNYDLRYRLKDKIYLPPTPKTPASVTPMELAEHVGEGIEESKGAGSVGRGGRAGDGGSAAASTSGCENRESGFLLVTWNNVVLCEGNVLQLYDFAGVKVREWILDAVIRCARVDGGPSGGEALLLGLQDGAVLRVFVNSAFPVELVKVSAPVVCCAMSLHRKKISVVDVKSRVMVFDVLSKELLFQESGGSSVAFNSSVENTMCYTGDGKLYVRTGSFPVQEQLIGGDVQSYQGSRVVSFEGAKLRTADVPLTNAVYRHLEAREFQQAYAVASLGVTQRDWEILGASALQALDFNTGRKAFARLRDLHLIDLVSEIEAKAVHEADFSKKDSAVRTKLEADASAELMAHQGNYQGAAKTWARNGMVDKAISMFIELRQWEEAKVFAASSGGLISGQELTRRQAEWAEEIGDWGAASKLFVQCAEPLRAAQLACKGRAEGWHDALAEIARSVPKTEVEVLSLCGKELSVAGHDHLAREAYLKMEDIPKVVALYVRSQNWSEAVKLSQGYGGKFDESVFLPYASWLRDQGEFDEALEAFHKAGRRDLSGAMTAQLISNAATKTHFDDASYYCWRSSKEAYAEAEDLDTNDKDRRRQALARASEHSRLADLYHAYHHVNSFTTDPFTDLQPDVLLQASRFLVNSLGDAEPPKGISTAHTLYTLAKQAKVLGAFKLARFAYDRLQRQRVPPLWQDQIDLDMLTVQAKPVQDNPELFAACFRCGTSNPLLSPFSAVSLNRGSHDENPLSWGDACTTCRHPFVRSFFNFEALPLVEFEPEPGIGDDKALELIRTTPPRGARHGRGGALAQQWREAKRDSADVMTLDVDEVEAREEEEEGMITGDEIFNRSINAALEAQEERTSIEYTPVMVGASCLRALRREDVFRVPPGTCGASSRLFKNMMPDIPLALSQPCGRFFHEEDFEFAYLREGRCPFSRVKDVGDYGSC